MVDGVTGFPLESAPLHVEEESRGMRGGVTTPSLKMEVSLVVEMTLNMSLATPTVVQVYTSSIYNPHIYYIYIYILSVFFLFLDVSYIN